MKIRIGTRKSRLAMAQTKMVCDEIKNKYPDAELEIVNFSTKGDIILDKPLSEIGGKGLFVSEIERALQKNSIDIAVHSAKDLPCILADGLEISAVLKRGNYRDLLVFPKERIFGENDIFTVGTGSLRRRNNLAKIYPNAQFKSIRGNVETRLKKLDSGEYDAIILAAAGIERLGLKLENYNVSAFDYTEFLPAPCQGIIAVESRKNDFVTAVTNSISDKKTFMSFETERKVIELLGGDCSTPLGAYSFIDGNKIYLTVSENPKITVSGEDNIENRLKLAKELTLQL